MPSSSTQLERRTRFEPKYLARLAPWLYSLFQPVIIYVNFFLKLFRVDADTTSSNKRSHDCLNTKCLPISIHQLRSSLALDNDPSDYYYINNKCSGSFLFRSLIYLSTPKRSASCRPWSKGTDFDSFEFQRSLLYFLLVI